MRLLIQRVSQAQVTVESEVTGKIGPGLLVFLGVHINDTADSISWLVNKLVNLRVFPDADGKMNLSVQDIEGEILVVSQFTLYGTCTKGRRPEFTKAAKGPEARTLYNAFVEEVKNTLGDVQTGRFAAKMDVSLVNDGPITLLLEG